MRAQKSSIVITGLSVWIRLRASKADLAVGVCYRPPNQSSEVDEAFYKQLVEISRSLAVVLVGDFNLPVSAGIRAQQRGNKPGGSWNVWRITSSHRW